MKSEDQFDLQKFYLEYNLDGRSIDKARCKCYTKLDYYLVGFLILAEIS